LVGKVRQQESDPFQVELSGEIAQRDGEREALSLSSESESSPSPVADKASSVAFTDPSSRKVSTTCS